MGATAAEDKIWPLLVEASRHDWSRHAVWHGRRSGTELTLDADGAWRSDSDFDDSAAALLDVLAPIVTNPRLVIAQLGQSLDGRIATRTGHSHYINGKVALTHLHRLRALVDAVIVGAETACADRPRLDVRHVDGPNPACVVIDPSGRVPLDGPLFQTEGRTLIHLIGDAVAANDPPGHVEQVRMKAGDGGFEAASILSVLASRGLHRVLVEGGSHTVSRFLHAGALDRLHLLIAPLIIGSGRNGLALPPIDRLDQARRPAMRSFALGDELLVDVDLRGSSDFMT